MLDFIRLKCQKIQFWLRSLPTGQLRALRDSLAGLERGKREVIIKIKEGSDRKRWEKRWRVMAE